MKDGFIEGYEGNQLSAYFSDKNTFSTMVHNPIKSYNSEYNGGQCTLNIYDNGQYAWNCRPGSTGYVRQTQTASLAAEAYGWGYFSYMNGADVGYKLITNVSYGNISVSIQVP